MEDDNDDDDDEDDFDDNMSFLICGRFWKWTDFQRRLPPEHESGICCMLHWFLIYRFLLWHSVQASVWHSMVYLFHISILLREFVMIRTLSFLDYKKKHFADKFPMHCTSRNCSCCIVNEGIRTSFECFQSVYLDIYQLSASRQHTHMSYTPFKSPFHKTFSTPWHAFCPHYTIRTNATLIPLTQYCFGWLKPV